VQVTVSIGLADTRVGLRPAAVVKAADQALYVAKDGGRNQVRAYAGQGVLAVRGG
jgi:PleD family two-component response regulator